MVRLPWCLPDARPDLAGTGGAGGAGRHRQCGRPCHTLDCSGRNYPGSTAETPLLPEPAIENEGACVHDAVVSEVLVIHEPLKTLLYLHTRVVSQ